jgi:hypothetical protein
MSGASGATGYYYTQNVVAGFVLQIDGGASGGK